MSRSIRFIIFLKNFHLCGQQDKRQTYSRVKKTKEEMSTMLQTRESSDCELDCELVWLPVISLISSTVETMKVMVEMKMIRRDTMAKMLAPLLVQGFSMKSHTEHLGRILICYYKHDDDDDDDDDLI